MCDESRGEEEVVRMELGECEDGGPEALSSECRLERVAGDSRLSSDMDLRSDLRLYLVVINMFI